MGGKGRSSPPVSPRSTSSHYQDLDLGRQDDEEAATTDFLAAQSLDLGDYFTFATERTGRLDAMEGLAVRYRVAAELAGRVFENSTVDVGFGDPLVGADLVRGPNLLDFADIRPVELPALPLEQHVAEKLHAYTRSYVGGRPSTRVKDLLDLALMTALFNFQAGRLKRALNATFSSRATHRLPSALPVPPPDWQVAYRRMASQTDMDADMVSGYREAAAFLDPILLGTISDGAEWDPRDRVWRQIEDKWS